LDALDDAVFTRVDRKILALAGNPRSSGCKGRSGLPRAVILDDPEKFVTVTRVAHGREVYPGCGS
jgi:hypothetical protein